VKRSSPDSPELNPQDLGCSLRLWRISSGLVFAHAPVMVSFSSPENVHALKERLVRMAKGLEDVEIEELVSFNPGVEARLRKAGISYRSANDPRNIPPERVWEKEGCFPVACHFPLGPAQPPVPCIMPPE
jgi:hypothetical protein